MKVLTISCLMEDEHVEIMDVLDEMILVSMCQDTYTTVLDLQEAKDKVMEYAGEWIGNKWEEFEKLVKETGELWAPIVCWSMEYDLNVSVLVMEHQK